MDIRIILEEEDMKELDILKDKLQGNLRDVFGLGITLLHWTLLEIEADRIIASVNEEAESYKELAIPKLEEFRKRVQANLAAKLSEKGEQNA